MRVGKICAIILCVLFSGGVLGYHQTGTFWPALPIFGAVGAVAILFAVVHQRGPTVVTTLGLVIGLGAAYRVGHFSLAPSLISIDPQAQAVQVQWIVETATIDNMPNGFYSVAALFNTLTATAAILMDLRADHALVVYPLLVSITVPMLAIAIGWRSYTDVSAESVKVMALLTAVGAASLHFGMAPITQVISLPLLGISVWSLLCYLRTDDFRFFVTLGGCVLALTFAHKLPVFVLTLILATATVGSYVLRVSNIYQRRIRRLTALVGATLAVQWAVLTAFAGKVVGLGGGLIVSILRGEFGLESSTESSHAVSAVDSTVVSVIHNLHLLLFVAAALAGVALLIREIRQQTHPGMAVLLSAVLFLGWLTGMGAMTPLVGGSSRPLLYGELYFTIGIALWLGRYLHQSSQTNSLGWRSVAALGILVVVVVAQFGAVTANPDYPDTPRMYLNNEEIATQEFETAYINETVSADRYYADFVADPRVPVENNNRIAMETVAQPWHPGVLEEELSNATLIDKEPPYVTYRDIEVYRLQGGSWAVLTWDPQEALEANYHQVYDSGETETYRHEN